MITSQPETFHIGFDVNSSAMERSKSLSDRFDVLTKLVEMRHMLDTESQGRLAVFVSLPLPSRFSAEVRELVSAGTFPLTRHLVMYDAINDLLIERYEIAGYWKEKY